MTTLQASILSIIFLVACCLLAGASFALFFGFAVVSITWAMYAVFSVQGSLCFSDAGIVWVN